MKNFQRELEIFHYKIRQQQKIMHDCIQSLRQYHPRDEAHSTIEIIESCTTDNDNYLRGRGAMLEDELMTQLHHLTHYLQGR